MVQNDTINELLEKIQQKANEIKEIYTTLQTLKKYGTDIELPNLNSLLASNGEMNLTKNTSILPDEFFRLSKTEAAERYLRKIGHAVSLGEIYDALIRGGVQFAGAGDPKNTLNVQLTRATKKFAKIGSGQSNVSFGLLEWYPKRRRIKTEESGIGSEQSELEINDDFTTEEKIEQEEIQE